jgi:hypothetical protein
MFGRGSSHLLSAVHCCGIGNGIEQHQLSVQLQLLDNICLGVLVCMYARVCSAEPYVCSRPSCVRHLLFGF